MIRPTLSARLFVHYILPLLVLVSCQQSPPDSTEPPRVRVTATLVETEPKTSDVPEVTLTSTVPAATAAATVAPTATAPDTTTLTTEAPGESIVMDRLEEAESDVLPYNQSISLMSDAAATFSEGRTFTTNSRFPEIQLIFTEPMAAETVLSAITIEPHFDFSLRWQDGQTAYLSSNVPLEPGERYTISIAPHARSRDWEPLAETTTLSLQMRALIKSFAARGANGLKTIVVEFNYPMSTESTNRAFRLVPPVGGDVSWNETATVMNFVPRKRLSADTRFTVFFAGEFEDQLGEKVTHQARLPFYVATALPVAGQYHYEEIDPTESIRIPFDRPVDRASVEDAFSINPPIDGIFSWSGNTLSFLPNRGHYEQFTRYQVHLGTSALDDVGQPLLREQVTLHFYTYQFVDVADFGDGPSVQVVTTNGRRAIHYRGMSQRGKVANFALYTLPPAEIVPLLSSGGLEGTGVEPTGLVLVAEWQQMTTASDDYYLNPQEVTLPDEIPAGAYVLTLSGEYFNDAILVVLTDELLTLKRAADQLIVWV